MRWFLVGRRPLDSHASPKAPINRHSGRLVELIESLGRPPLILFLENQRRHLRNSRSLLQANVPTRLGDCTLRRHACKGYNCNTVNYAAHWRGWKLPRLGRKTPWFEEKKLRASKRNFETRIIGLKLSSAPSFCAPLRRTIH